MQKHVQFWIGFFAAMLVALLTTLLFWGGSKEFAESLAVIALGSTAVIVLFLVILLLFRNIILRKIIGAQTSSLDNIAAHGVKAVAATVKRDIASAEMHTEEAVKNLITWYSWTSFYRWVIGSCLALLLACAGFVGTLLLFEQNARLTEQTELLDVQNAISSITVVADLRQQLLRGANVNEVNERYLVESSLHETQKHLSMNGCSVSIKDRKNLLYPPSEAVVQSIVNLAKSPRINEQIVEALINLLRDRNSSVVLGAISALDQLNRLPEGEGIQLRNVSIQDWYIEQSAIIQFSQSIVVGVGCDDCEFLFDSSVYLPAEDTANKIYEANTTLFWNKQNSLKSVIDGADSQVNTNLGEYVESSIIDAYGFIYQRPKDTDLNDGNFVIREDGVLLPPAPDTVAYPENPPTSCEELANIAARNPFLVYSKDTAY